MLLHDGKGAMTVLILMVCTRASSSLHCGLQCLLHILFLFIESILHKINWQLCFWLVLDFSKQLTSHTEPPGLHPTVGAGLDYNRTKISTHSSRVLSYLVVCSLSFNNIVNDTIVLLQTMCSSLPPYCSSLILCWEQK